MGIIRSKAKIIKEAAMREQLERRLQKRIEEIKRIKEYRKASQHPTEPAYAFGRQIEIESEVAFIKRILATQ